MLLDVNEKKEKQMEEGLYDLEKLIKDTLPHELWLIISIDMIEEVKASYERVKREPNIPQYKLEACNMRIRHLDKLACTVLEGKEVAVFDSHRKKNLEAFEKSLDECKKLNRQIMDNLKEMHDE